MNEQIAHEEREAAPYADADLGRHVLDLDIAQLAHEPLRISGHIGTRAEMAPRTKREQSQPRISSHDAA